MSLELSKFNDVTRKLRKYLPEYLKSQGVVVEPEGKKFNCFAHKDNTPSMQFVTNSNQEAFICYGCSIKGDIFRAANHFEGLPLEGKDWLRKTVTTLCQRFNVEAPEIELTEDQLKRIRLLQLASNTFEILKEVGDTKEAISRGLTDEAARTWGTLVVPDTNAFFNKVITSGNFKEDLLRDVGYGYKTSHGNWESWVFGPRFLTIPIRSIGGHIVGFTGRNLDFKKEGNHHPKYKDQKKTDIFNRSELLYGYDKAVKARSHFVYMFEGYFDVIIAQEAGITNSVASCGTSISPDQIELLQKASIHHIVLCFDRDPNDAGWLAMDKLISETFKGYQSLRVEILELPDGYRDPDEFILKNGKVAFEELPKKSAFRWRMERKQAAGSKIDSDFVNEMVQLIAMEPSPIFRTDMNKELADFSHRTTKEIEDAIRAILDRKEAGFISALETLKAKATSQIKNSHGTGFVETLRTVSAEADQLEKTFVEGETNTSASTIELIDKMILFDDSHKPDIVWKTGIRHYDEAYDGLPKQDVLVGLLGNPSAGKSSFCAYLAKQILLNNKNVAVLFHSTDDAKIQVVRKIISNMCGIKEIKIRKGMLTSDEKIRVKNAAALVKQWMFDNSFEIRDAADGFEVVYAERWIKQFRDNNPDKSVLYILDNFYKTWVDNTDQARARVEAGINRLQLLAQIEHVTILCTLEPRKTGDRPRLKLEDIKETKKVRQNLHIGWIIHNGCPSDGSESEFICGNKTWKNSGGEKPMVELQIAKYKDMPPGSVFMEFDYDVYGFKSTEFVNQLEMTKRGGEQKPAQTSQYPKKFGGKMRPSYFDAPEGEEIEGPYD